jgi:hypothetical protein
MKSAWVRGDYRQRRLLQPDESSLTEAALEISLLSSLVPEV